MDFCQLKYCLEVAKCNNFTRAADECFIAQSSLSVQISKLEAELGIRIFERTPKGVKLTKAGVVFLDFAEKVCDMEADVRNALRVYEREDDGVLTLGMVHGSSNFDLTDLIASYKQSFPFVELDIYEEESSKLMEMLQQNELDAAFISAMELPSMLKTYLLYSDEVVLIVGKNHRLADRDEIYLAELMNEPLIFSKTSSIREYLETDVLKDMRMCKKDASFNMCITHNTHISTNIGLVASGMGATMVTRKTAEKNQIRGISIIKVKPAFYRHIFLAISNNSFKFPVVKGFIQHILQTYHNLNQK
ncbi:LysR family transcriptional regulator [Candidatus Formimonas warabiya]|uniref:HTH lysR-type domain-containing protein n=1 Tax=Formimonas warabiya TaxID=1761012 RepID=A0A3G1KNH0_FORW1|nr:LysR family transcriptional regulator [Candidatus Formimonas warabiya]ATW24012.1 hypothetical protein DCMF_03685 [Candidatus Formimonas warabiya]